MSIEEIIAEVDRYSNFGCGLRIKFVVITGGEPFLQPIGMLCTALLSRGYKIQIETNGSIFKRINRAVDIVCSPKNVNGKFLFDARFLPRIMAFKFLISKTCPGYQDVPNLGQESFRIPIYVQPMDENCSQKNNNNLQLVREICLRHGYKLSFQLHKLIGIK